MKTKNAVLLIVVILMLCLISCASSVSIEEFEAYVQTNDQKVVTLQQEIMNLANKGQLADMQRSLERIDGRLGSVETALQHMATQEEVSVIRGELETICTDFSVVQDGILNFVRISGYDDVNALLAVGADIIAVNNNIAVLHERLDRLKAAMALFAQ